MLQRFSNIMVLECSFIQLHVDTLPPSISRGLQLDQLPRMGASPDAMLWCQAPDGSIKWIPVECKAPCPFQHSNGPGDATWAYQPQFAGWDAIPAPYFAPCQLILLATDCPEMLLMQYLPATTKVYLVQRDDAWATAMLGWLQVVNMRILRTGAVGGMAELIREHQGGYDVLLGLTKAGCSSVRLVAQLDSYNATSDGDKLFID